jgi:hypothetical protein
MNLLSVLLKTLMADGAISALAKKTGIGSAALKKLLPLAIPLLLKAMTNNVSSQSGVQSLLGALTQHTSTKSMPEQIAEADQEDGSKILGHILGGNAASELNGLAAQTGLSANEVGSALSGIAPALLSGLSAATSSSGAAGKVDLSDGLDLGDVMAMLGGGQSAAPAGGLLGSLLGGGQSNASSGGLLGSLLGGGQSNASSGGLLGSLFGGSQNSAPAAGGLLGSLLSGGIQENDNSLNGNALMSALLSAMK